jgi:hypothetical protein
MATIFQERVEIQWKGRSLMGLLDWLFGDDDDDIPDDIFDDNPNVRVAKDGTIFRDPTDDDHVIIEHPNGTVSVGHNDKDG